MNRKLVYLLIAQFVVSPAAMAHQDVADPDVKARMNVMSSISESMKNLGEMAKGAVSFDQQKAMDALANIADFASRIPVRFEKEATDPKSEAKPDIWNDFEDFTQKSESLAQLATKLAATPINEDGIRTVVSELGAACKACHSVYRE